MTPSRSRKKSLHTLFGPITAKTSNTEQKDLPKLQGWPKAFYVEASILRKLPLDIMNAEMQRLHEWAKALQAGIFIPEVSLKEWLPHQLERVKSLVDGADRRVHDLARLFSYVSEISWEKDKETIVNDTELATRKILQEKGISIIPTPELDLNMLIDMSIQKMRPFEEEKEKGFRDSINLFTVLEFAKSQVKGAHLLVAEDNAYRHPDVMEIAKRYQVDLIVVQSVGKVISMLEGFNELVRKRILIYKKAVLKEFLKRNIPIIESYIKQNAAFDISSWHWGFKPGVTGTIEEISDIKVDDIDSVTRGVLPDKQTAGRVKVSFIAKATLVILMRPRTPLPRQRLKSGERPSPIHSHVGFSPEYKTQPPEYKPVPTDIQVEATVFLETEKQTAGPDRDKYRELEIEGVVTE